MDFTSQARRIIKFAEKALQDETLDSDTVQRAIIERNLRIEFRRQNIVSNALKDSHYHQITDEELQSNLTNYPFMASIQARVAWRSILSSPTDPDKDYHNQTSTSINRKRGIYNSGHIPNKRLRNEEDRVDKLNQMVRDIENNTKVVETLLNESDITTSVDRPAINVHPFVEDEAPPPTITMDDLEIVSNATKNISNTNTVEKPYVSVSSNSRNEYETPYLKYDNTTSRFGKIDHRRHSKESILNRNDNETHTIRRNSKSNKNPKSIRKMRAVAKKYHLEE